MKQEESAGSRDQLLQQLSELPGLSLPVESSRRIRDRAHTLLRKQNRSWLVRSGLDRSWSWLLQPAVAIVIGSGYLAWAVQRIAALLAGSAAILNP